MPSKNLSQHAEWLSLIDRSGPFLSVGALETVFPQGLDKVVVRIRQRVRSAYEEWRDAVDAEDPDLEALHQEWVNLVLNDLLEYDATILKRGDALPESLVYEEPLTGITIKPDAAVMAGDQAQILIMSYPAGTQLNASAGRDRWSATPIERMTALCKSVKIQVGLVTNGESWALVSVPHDGASSFGTWYARIWSQEPLTLQAFQSLLSCRRCFGVAEETLKSLFEKSLEHQDEVTNTLGEQVRRAVEVLVQALDRADMDRNRELLKDVSEAQLYEAGLTVMMRLVVILCAEERGLLLLGDPIYDQHYAVSSLRAQLREDAERMGLEVLDRRHDAWSRLLGTFRAVYGGIEHETLRMPALGGSLFDPDRFPFLEGRATGTGWLETSAFPLPIDNRTVLLLLSALQVLQHRSGAQLLSYQALDVEQIGHVYEGLLERTVSRVSETTLGLEGTAKFINPNVSLAQIEAAASDGAEALADYVREHTGRNVKRLLSKKPDAALTHKVLHACGGDAELTERVLPFAQILRLDSWGEPLVYKANSFAVTMGADRRETGAHYTPKSLTEPIVQHTLEPLLYVGPSEGKPLNEWKLKAPSEILALKVCDMAMGSAAFLVQACRWMAERLIEAWSEAEGVGKQVSVDGEVLQNSADDELMPRDRGERILIARRLIAGRCLYGVDINPMAVELAKLSLWLITMQKNKPFGFLDHALKSGDSLLGVSFVKQIENFSLRSGERQVTFSTANLFRLVDEAAAKRSALEELPSNDYVQIKSQNQLHAEAEAATARVKAVADALIAFELRGLNGDAYEKQRAEEAEKIQLRMKRDFDASYELPAHTYGQLRGRTPFHWALEFPEVFARGGFDAFVGNPPFMGGKKITSSFGTDYRDHLVRNLAEARLGVADLCAYFFLRVNALMRADGGTCGLVATNTIAQGDTREVGLGQLIVPGGMHIIRAVVSTPWPGAAALEVAYVWLHHGEWSGDRILNQESVSEITASLTRASRVSGNPFRLAVNLGKSYQGSILLGMGFTLSPDEAHEILSKDAKYHDVIFPYINGSDLNTRPDQSPSRFVINFNDWPLMRSNVGTWKNAQDFERKAWLRNGIVPLDYAAPVAADYPLCLEIVEEKVKPGRDIVKRNIYRNRWWNYAERQSSLYAALKNVPRVFAAAQTSKFTKVSVLSPELVFSNAVILLLFSDFGTFAVLNSAFHTEWVAEYASSLETRLRYVPTDCLENFPLPECLVQLEVLGREFEDYLSSLMLALDEGLTKTYNRFHSSSDESEGIVRLRALHVEIDQAVAAAYGWSDIELDPGFHATKQGERYTISESARMEVLDRLLTLNHERYAEEEAAGLHDKKAKKKTAAKKAVKKSQENQGELLI